MDIIKPEFLSLTGQPLDWKGAMHHALTVGFGFSLADGAPLKAEVAWGAAMQGLASGFCVDTGVPKKQAEWLLSGAVCAPQDPAVQGKEANSVRGLVGSCAVGQSRREWLASGERRGSEITPFTEMPLIWANTWGSPSSQDNPLGCGIEPDAAGVLRAPTISEKDATSRRATCPGPVGPWPCRMKHMGTYDEKWLQERWPGVPDDFDWEFFNLAQPAQRLPNGLQGGERLELLNLHPSASRLELNAPEHQIRVEILRVGETAWLELAATRDTLWLFPGRLTGLYLWHALATCTDEAASDIASVRLTLIPEIAVEAAPPPELGGAVAGAAGAAAGAAGAAAGAGTTAAAVVGAAALVGLGATLLGGGSPEKAAEQQQGVAPDAQAAVPDAQAAVPDAQSAAPAAQQATDSQTAASQTAAPQAVEPDPAQADEIPPAGAYMTAVQADALADLDASIDELNDGLVKVGLSPLTPEQVQETRERIIAMSSAVGNLLETPDPTMEEVLRQAGLSEERIEAVNAVLKLEVPNPGDYADAASWNAATEVFAAQFAGLMHPNDKVLQNMRTGLSFAGPDGQAAIDKALGPLPSADEIIAKTGMDPIVLRAEMDRLNQEGLPGLDDMDGLTAKAAELERALGLPPESMTVHINRFTRFMRDHKLLPPQITTLPPPAASAAEPGTAPAQPEPIQSEPVQPEPVQPASESPDSAEEAPPAPKSREEVLLLMVLGASLAGLVFAGLSLEGMDFSDRDLRGAVFDNAALDSADFSGSDVTGGSFAGADLSGADFTGTNLAGVSFAGAQGTDASFAGAVLAGAVLSGANLHSADFAGADMQGVQATGSVLDRASFVNTDLRGGNFASSSFNRADFHAASAEKAVFARADMTNASLGFGTSVAGADFSGACLKGGAWDGVNAASGTFAGAMADNAAFVGCDFSAASWAGARAREADFSRAKLDNTDLRGADLFKASLRETGAETADLSGANLYNADLYRLHTSPLTKMDGADINATILAARKKGL